MLEKIFGVRLTDPEDVAEFARLRLKGMSVTEAMETTLDARLDRIIRSCGWAEEETLHVIATFHTGKIVRIASGTAYVDVHAAYGFRSTISPNCRFEPAPDGTLPWELIRKAVKRAVKARKELSKIT